MSRVLFTGYLGVYKMLCGLGLCIGFKVLVANLA